MTRGGSQAPRESLGQIVVQKQAGPHEQRDAVPLQPAPRVAQAQLVAQRTRRLEEGALEGGHVEVRFEASIGGSAPHVGEHHDALVAGDLRTAQMEAGDLVRRLEALELEGPQTVEVDAGGGLRVQPVQALQLLDPIARPHPATVRQFSAGRPVGQRDALGRQAPCELRGECVAQRALPGAFLAGNQQLDGLDVLAPAGGRRCACSSCQPFHDGARFLRMDDAAQDRAPVAQIEPFDVNAADHARGVPGRGHRSVEAAHVGRDRDGPSARIAVDQPTAHAVENTSG